MHKTPTFLRTARRLRVAVGLAAGLGLLACAVVEDSASEQAATAKATTKATASPDIVLVTLDTLRADSLGFAGNAKAETPLLDRLAHEGRWFLTAHAHSLVTLPSHTNILTGLYPYQHGVRENSGFVLSADVPTLATYLRDAGYATGAFVGAYPLDSRFGLDRGFQVYDDHYSHGLDPRNPSFPERRGDEVVGAARAWWQESATKRPQAPRFLWVHLYDPHAPYAAPEPWASRFAGNEYLGEVAATDAFLRPLLEPLLDVGTGRAGPEGSRPALVVVTSDHGEGLGDHGEVTHGLFAYEPTLHVPLILWGVGVTPGVDERSVGHVDIAPTILRQAGLPVPAELPGRSLLGSPDPDEFSKRRLYFEALSAFYNRGWAPLRGFVAAGDKMIELPLPELYDLVKDPGEVSNQVEVRGDRFRALQQELPEGDSWPPGRSSELDSEEVAALQALGYVTGDAPRKASYGVSDDPKSLIHLDRMFHMSIDAYHRHNLAKAEDLTRRILAERPDMTSTYGILVMTLREAGRPGDAIEVMEKAVKDGFADDDLLLHLGSTYSEIGRPAKAIEVLEPIVADGNPAVLAALGIAYSDVGNQARARELLDRLLAKEPDDTQGHENYGVVSLRLQQPAAAQAHFEKALELNEDLPFSWNNLGVARAWQGDERGAVEAWRRAIALDPDLLDALYNLGLTAAKLGDADIARQALAHYIEVAPADRFAPDIARARQILEQLP